MPRRARAPSQILATVMFTDIVGSTEMAASLGDRDWKRLLAKHHAIMRKELKRHRGREMDTAGDGFFNTFEQPGDAIACAVAVSERLEPLGVHIRAGVHMGQVEVDGPKVQGIAVNIGARVMSKAGDDEVLVSSTVRDALAGAEVQFEDRGTTELKGVPGEWRLFVVEKSPQLIAAALGTEPVAAPEPVGVESVPRPPWIRRPASWAILAVGLVTVVAVVVVATRSRGGDDFTPVIDSVVRLDPSSGAVEGGAEVGSFPMGVAATDGFLWVADSGGGTITQVDTTGSAAPKSVGIKVTGDPFGVAAGDDSVWVSLGGQGGDLVRVDLDGTIQPGIPVGTGYGGIEFGAGSVWLVNADQATLTMVDPVTEGRTPFPLEGAEQPLDLVIEGDSIWITDGLGKQVLQFDQGSGEVVDHVDLDGAPSGIALGGGSLWITMPEDDAVVRIDPAQQLRLNTIDHICDNPRGIASGEDSVWVTCTNDGVVAQISTTQGTVVRRVDLGDGLSPEGVVVTDDGVWVTIHAR